MVDQALYESIRVILYKVELIKKRKDLHEALLAYGIDSSNLTDDELNIAIANNLLTNAEANDYFRFLKFKEIEDRKQFIENFCLLGEGISTINGLYDQKDGINKKIKAIKSKSASLNGELREFPRIKLGTKYSIVKGTYDKYLSSFIRFGMREYELKDGIRKINGKNVIFRTLKSAKVKKLSRELKHLKGMDVFSVNALLEKFKKEKEEYVLYIETIIKGYFRNSKFKQPMAVSCYVFDGKLDLINRDKNGIPYVDGETLKSFDEEYLLTLFFRYFERYEEEDISSKKIEEAFNEFVLLGYNFELEGLEKQKMECVSNIRKEHESQKSLVEKMKCNRKIVPFMEDNLTVDERDTLSLIYTNIKK